MTSQPTTPEQFVAEWKGRHLTERASSQAHFIQLCRLLGVPAPLDSRVDDPDYCFDALTETAGSHIYAASKSAKPKRGRKAEPSQPLWAEPAPTETPADPSDLPLTRIVSAKSAVMAEAAQDKRLKVRTLTNLYNERPAWLRLAHEKLDRAVLAAYSAVDSKGGWEPEWAKVYEPFGAGEIVIKDGKPKKLSAKARSGKKDDEGVAEAKRAALAAREPVDAKILANLLRLNKQRAGASGAAK